MKASASENASLSELSIPRQRPSSNSSHGYYTSADYHSLYKSGILTPIDIVNSLLPLIRRDITPAGHHSSAFLDSKVEIIRQAAEASTARYAAGQPLSCLDGVPIAVKDEVELESYKRTLGSILDFTNSANKTAWCVKMLEDAGAVVVGKTNMHEMGLGASRIHSFSRRSCIALLLHSPSDYFIQSIWPSHPTVEQTFTVLMSLCHRHHKQQPQLRHPAQPSQSILLYWRLVRRFSLCCGSRPCPHRRRR